MTASERRSKFESKNAPAFDSIPVLRATAPSKMSKIPDNIKKSGANQVKYTGKCNDPIAIKNAAIKEHENPM